MSKGIGQVQRKCLEVLPSVVKEITTWEETEETPRDINGRADWAKEHSHIQLATTIPGLTAAIYGSNYTRSQRNSVARAICKLGNIGKVETFWRVARLPNRNWAYNRIVWSDYEKHCLWVSLSGEGSMLCV